MSETPLHPLVDPYANRAHRAGCGCSECAIMRVGDDVPQCRQCLSWKRRGRIAGSCWHPSNDGARKLEHDTCEYFERRVIHVERAEGAQA